MPTSICCASHYDGSSTYEQKVDIVLETGRGILAVEIKSKSQIRPSDLRGLYSFLGEYKGSKGICVTTADRPYEVNDIECLPWQEFLQKFFP